MNQKAITRLDGLQFSTEQQATEQIQFIIDNSGVKSTEKGCGIIFISLQKEVLIRAGISLYSIWIKETYNTLDKKVYEISLQTEYVFGWTIGQFIREALAENRIILSSEMKNQLSIN